MVGGRVATNFGGVDAVPLQGVIVVYHAAGKGRDGHGAIVVYFGWRKPTNFGGVVPLQLGAKNFPSLLNVTITHSVVTGFFIPHFFLTVAPSIRELVTSRSS